VPDDLPQERRGDAAQEGAPERHPPGGQHHVEGGEHQRGAAHSDGVEERAGQARERPGVTEHLDRAAPERLEPAGDERDEEEPGAERHHEHVGDDGRQGGVAPLRRAMVEDHRHRVLEDRKGEGAEEQQREDADPPHHVAVREERGDLLGDRGRLAGHEKLEVQRHRVNQEALVDEMRQRHQQEREQGHQRQQRVVGHRAREEQALVPPEVAEQAAGEDVERARHRSTRGESSRTVPA
jgi:hypothetical protein